MGRGVWRGGSFLEQRDSMEGTLLETVGGARSVQRSSQSIDRIDDNIRGQNEDNKSDIEYNIRVLRDFSDAVDDSRTIPTCMQGVGQLGEIGDISGNLSGQLSSKQDCSTSNSYCSVAKQANEAASGEALAGKVREILGCDAKEDEDYGNKKKKIRLNCFHVFLDAIWRSIFGFFRTFMEALCGHSRQYEHILTATKSRSLGGTSEVGSDIKGLSTLLCFHDTKLEEAYFVHVSKHYPNRCIVASFFMTLTLISCWLINQSYILQLDDVLMQMPEQWIAFTVSMATSVILSCLFSLNGLISCCFFVQHIEVICMTQILVIFLLQCVFCQVFVSSLIFDPSDLLLKSIIESAAATSTVHAMFYTMFALIISTAMPIRVSRSLPFHLLIMCSQVIASVISSLNAKTWKFISLMWTISLPIIHLITICDRYQNEMHDRKLYRDNTQAKVELRRMTEHFNNYKRRLPSRKLITTAYEELIAILEEGKIIIEAARLDSGVLEKEKLNNLHSTIQRALKTILKNPNLCSLYLPSGNSQYLQDIDQGMYLLMSSNPIKSADDEHDGVKSCDSNSEDIINNDKLHIVEPTNINPSLLTVALPIYSLNEGNEHPENNSGKYNDICNLVDSLLTIDEKNNFFGDDNGRKNSFTSILLTVDTTVKRQLNSVNSNTISVPNGTKKLVTSHISYQTSLAHFLAKIGISWNLDMFMVSELTKNNEIMVVGQKFLTHYVKCGVLKCKREVLWNFLLAIQGQYFDNPYHNRIHAAHVTHSTMCIANMLNLIPSLTNFSYIALVVASVCHDVRHPGKNNPFLVNIADPIALTYNDISVLENYHACITFRTLQLVECNIFVGLSNDDFRYLRKHIISLIMVTDMFQHFEMNSIFRARRSCAEYNVNQNEGDRWLLAKMCLKLGDLGHTCATWEQHEKWTDRIMEEFFIQGDEEEKLGLPKSLFCNREELSEIPKSQVGFLNFVIQPLVQTLLTVDTSGLFRETILYQLQLNMAKWQEMENCSKYSDTNSTDTKPVRANS